MGTMTQNLVDLVIVAALVAAIYFAITAFPDPAYEAAVVAHQAPPTNTSQSQDWSHWDGDRIAGDVYFGCTERDCFERLATLAVQGDKQAFAEALGVGLLTGICTKFVEGEPIYLMGAGGLFSGLVRVRRPGEITEYWTVIEAVE